MASWCLCHAEDYQCMPKDLQVKWKKFLISHYAPMCHFTASVDRSSPFRPEWKKCIKSSNYTHTLLHHVKGSSLSAPFNRLTFATTTTISPLDAGWPGKPHTWFITQRMASISFSPSQVGNQSKQRPISWNGISDNADKPQGVCVCVDVCLDICKCICFLCVSEA